MSIPRLFRMATSTPRLRIRRANFDERQREVLAELERQDARVGQVAMLTIPPGRVGNGFRMQTREQWDAERLRRTESTQGGSELEWPL